MKTLKNLQHYFTKHRDMYKKIKLVLIASILILPLSSCFEDLDDNAVPTSDIKDYVWKAMNSEDVHEFSSKSVEVSISSSS